MELNSTARLILEPLLNSSNMLDFIAGQRQSFGKDIGLCGMAGSSYAAFIAAAVSANRGIHIALATGRDEAMSLFDDLKALTALKNNSIPEGLLFFPTSWKKEHQPDEADSRHLLMRTEVLQSLPLDKDLIIVSWPDALCEKVISPSFISKSTFNLHSGEKIDLAFLEEVLTGYHFRQVDFVSEPGEFAMRGGICDVYSFSDENPYRIVFYGDRAESIRSFDPSSQLTIASFESIRILPDINLAGADTIKVSFFDLLSENVSFWHSDSSIGKRFNDECIRLHETHPQGHYIHQQTWTELTKRFKRIWLSASRHINETVRNYEFNFSPQPPVNRRFDWLVEEIHARLLEGWKMTIVTENDKQTERIHSIFVDIEQQKKFQITEKVPVMRFPLSEGFSEVNLKFAVFTDHQMFNRYRRNSLHDRFNKPERISVSELVNLQPGDFVVHINHGIGRYAGLQKVMVNGREQEAIRLLYKDDDELLVSIHALHRISKYAGKDGTPPAIDRIGGTSWSTRKNKAKKKVKDIARELIRLYAKRRASEGFSFSPDSYLQHELEASFIWEDTPDQISATNSIKKDMENSCPMDRLICGDVGFGKTELAVRAAFKAVADSRQVAVLVPTTILAYQHFNTFSDRLNGLPAKIEYLNRFRSTKEQKEVIEAVKNGQIDILIGTHRLLSKDVSFKNLGLLIVDEEQKFGVAAKEKLRNLKENVDTLTLTATPIPRTLQFSLMGARDMSVLRTPPPNRYPVQTEVLTFNPDVIRDAIRQEINRGGQVYFVHNRISNLQDIADLILKLVPEAKVATGHGQMSGDELEKVMLQFVSGEIDVFISTAIVESGLDVSNANTMMINDAQNFGLSDLHQLRGRVGRSNRKAFCYLFTPPDTILSDESRKRLRAIAEFSDLGSGFQIAMRDLDIRGAGNLLGGEQSGFIAEIGYEMYQKILDEALSELRFEKDSGIKFANDEAIHYVHDVVIETDASVMIPDQYVPAVNERLVLYKDLNEITTSDQLDVFTDMLKDRFGPIPEAVFELINAVRLKWMAKELAVEKIVLKNNILVLYFISNKESAFFNSDAFDALITFASQNPRRCMMKEQNDRLVMKVENISTIANATELLQHISGLR